MKKKKKGLFRHLAWNGIKSNYKLYLPYILAAAGMSAMFYIILALSMSPAMDGRAAASSAGMVLVLGVIVIGIFSAIFMFYTNSFLIKTRTREFGLYNILGMSRRHIARIVAHETWMAAGMSIIGGLAIGFLFEKLAEMLFLRLIGEVADFTLRISPIAALVTALTFIAIFAIVMIRSMIRIFRLKTIDLFKSESFGEKPPKAKWVFTTLGVLILGAAYYLAVAMAAPVQAITMFFFAVIMVIIATYILFISGSVSVCRGLQKNKKFYYQTKHFVSLSSMVYRMKRNGAGLASICILSTMVLVMISSTSCLYFGKDASLMVRYPREIEYDVRFKPDTSMEKAVTSREKLRNDIARVAGEQGVTMSNITDFIVKGESTIIEKGVVRRNAEAIDINVNDASNAWDIIFITVDEYNAYMGTNISLNDGEAVCCHYQHKYPYDHIDMCDGHDYKIIDTNKDFFMFGQIASDIIPGAVFVVNELPELDADSDYLKWMYYFDLDVRDGELYDAYNIISEEVFGKEVLDKEALGINNFNDECRFMNRADFFGMYGGLFFLGISLSIVFICALVLILYYKQISEGYEDRARYEIMRKVGMTRDDIRKNVNSQMGSVFYMPFLAAVIHLAFACPMIFSMLKLFSVTEMKSLLVTAAISVVGFGLIYTIVYKITSNSYYKIVA